MSEPGCSSLPEVPHVLKPALHAHPDTQLQREIRNCPKLP